MADTISFARGAPSLDIVDVEGLKQAAADAFDKDPAGTTAYGTSVGYVPLREWIAEKHGVEHRPGARHQRLDAGRRVPVRAAGRGGQRGRRREADLRPHAAQPAQPRRPDPRGRARAGRHRRRCASQELLRGRRAARCSRTSSRTSRTPPATRCRRTSARSCCGSRPSTTSCSSRTTRTSTSASRARRCRRCSPRTRRARSSTRRRSRRPCARASASATSSARPP